MAKTSHPVFLLALLALAIAAPSALLAACEANATTLCLNEDRFRVELDWRNPYVEGQGGRGRARQLTADTGTFWFFNRDNVELTLKVLDGRPINGHFWVLYGSLSTVEFSLRITDSEQGWQRLYYNPPGEQTASSDIQAFSEQPLAGEVVYFGAHPDDETLFAPVLGELCAERGERCTLVVATRGEGGVCGLPEGCSPDLATVRSREMAAAAEVLRADLVLWDLADGARTTPEAVRRNWAAQAGGDEALINRFVAVLETLRPRVVVTFDPRHGSTCHVDHRALGALVIEAMARVPSLGAELYLLETVFDDSPLGFSTAVPKDPAVLGFDATLPADRFEASLWQYMVEVAEAHPSQIAPQTVTALGAVPGAQRRNDLLPWTRWRDDPRYAICTGSRESTRRAELSGRTASATSQ